MVRVFSKSISYVLSLHKKFCKWNIISSFPALSAVGGVLARPTMSAMCSIKIKAKRFMSASARLVASSRMALRLTRLFAITATCTLTLSV